MTDLAVEAPAENPRTVGTLAYTRSGLLVLFAWLIWGDFCITLMEQVIPSILPLKLKDLNAPDWVLSLIVTSIPYGLGMIANPIIGYKSDHLRTRFGRRIPLMLFATPFVALFLALLAFSPEIGTTIQNWIAEGAAGSQSTVVIVCIAVCMVGYRFFDMVAGHAFVFLLNDVIPPLYLTRFYAISRASGIGVSALYNSFVFQHGLTHMRLILLLAAAIYFAGFTVMCLNVKEGEYPPPPEAVGRHSVWEAIRTYFRECFFHRIYWFFFLHTACWNLGGASLMFMLFLNLSLGITLKQHGQITAVAQVLTVLLLYPAGALADRLHPLRAIVWAKSGILLTTLLNMIWLFKEFSPETNYYVLVCITAVTLPINVLYSAALVPMYMRVLPAQRYGQFYSACFVVTSLFGVMSGVMVGAFFDVLRRVFHAPKFDKDFCYRFAPCWSFFFFGIGLVFLLLLYREWKRCGGFEAYKAPELEDVPTSGTVTQPG